MEKEMNLPNEIKEMILLKCDIFTLNECNKNTYFNKIIDTENFLKIKRYYYMTNCFFKY